MPKYYYKGVIVAVIVSLCAIPCTRIGLGHRAVSQFAPMYILNYALLLTASIFFLAALPPNACPNRKTRPLRRNEIYYGCCLLMCCCMAGLTLQSFRLKRMGAAKVKHKVEYIIYDEAYLLTPFGMSTEFWMDVVNYIFYAAFVFLIDNNLSYRNIMLYWSGAMLTSEVVATLACFTGSYSRNLKYSEFMHIVNVVAAVWVIFKFLMLKPRRIEGRSSVSKFALLDKIIIVCFIFLSLFAAFRGLAALNGSQYYVKRYVILYEPYIAHPSRFAAIWILYTAVYGIPFQLASVHGLLRPGAEWLINMSILYAGSIAQGTFVYMSYSYFPSSELKFRGKSFVVIVLNMLLLISAHLLMYRCLKDPCYFHRPCLKVLLPKVKTRLAAT